ncbi:MAG: AmmeMemoRadiSam system radical SAM enzyme [Magnetococcales bacterium]|nr:AmmeMemoRadiSam system radical SAM enzyme [Magnetococcales bacterium]
MIRPVGYWHLLDNGRIQCDLCPRHCHMSDGQQGLCQVRGRQGDTMVLQGYGQASSLCIDPIEKKPLYHFMPGEAILSLGTVGCNLTCKFCQNWSITRSGRHGNLLQRLGEEAWPEQIAAAAAAMQCPMVAVTYNEPVVFLEYAVDVAKACHERGIRTVAVTAGYIDPAPRVELLQHIDAVNVDLKSFSEHFYRSLVGGHLQPVLETLRYIRHETQVWLEVTTLLIPGENDSDDELQALTGWLVEHLGPDVPLHFSAFHPDWQLRDRPATPAATLLRARSIAQANGLRHVYCGNVREDLGSHTWCHGCGTRLIARVGWEIADWKVTSDGYCSHCGLRCPGVFSGQHGRWGARRLPIRINSSTRN